MNKPQYYISVRSYSHPRVDILLSGKTIKQYASMVKNADQLKREASAYCEIQGWEYSFSQVGVA